VLKIKELNNKNKKCKKLQKLAEINQNCVHFEQKFAENAHFLTRLQTCLEHSRKNCI